MVSLTATSEKEQPLFDRADAEGASSSIPVEEELARDAMRGQLNRQLEEGAAEADWVLSGAGQSVR